MNPKTEDAHSKQNGGTGNLPVPRGNLPRGSRHARAANWFAFNEISRAQFRRASGPTERAGSPCHPFQFRCSRKTKRMKSMNFHDSRDLPRSRTFR